MGYFGARAAPMGAVSAGVVQATFFNFAPVHVQRAVPDVWGSSPPSGWSRSAAPAPPACSTRITPDLPAGVVAAAADALVAGGGGPRHGRLVPLAAANQALARGRRPLERLWQGAPPCASTAATVTSRLLVGRGLQRDRRARAPGGHRRRAPRRRLPARRAGPTTTGRPRPSGCGSRGWLDAQRAGHRRRAGAGTGSRRAPTTSPASGQLGRWRGAKSSPRGRPDRRRGRGGATPHALSRTRIGPPAADAPEAPIRSREVVPVRSSFGGGSRQRRPR